MHIAFFDSGLGGLSIVRELFEHNQVHQLAMAQCSYIADTAAFPYGDKHDAWLTERVVRVIAASLAQIKPDIVVIACNTASTLALTRLRATFDVPFVGVVPAVKPAAQISPRGLIGVLATPATVARHYTAQLIADYAPEHTVVLYGAAELVAQAENKLLGQPVDKGAIARALTALLEQGQGALTQATTAQPAIETIVLACTHFPLLREELIAACPYPVTWVDSGEAIARRVIQLGSAYARSKHCPLSELPLRLITTGGALAKRYKSLNFKVYRERQHHQTFDEHIALEIPSTHQNPNQP
ncbi:MAG TPA: glutamate racemase [Marinagarivorans sp.]